MFHKKGAFSAFFSLLFAFEFLSLGITRHCKDRYYSLLRARNLLIVIASTVGARQSMHGQTNEHSLTMTDF